MANTDDVFYYNLDVVNPSANQDYFGYGFPQCWEKTCHVIDLYYLFLGNEEAQSADGETLELSQSMRDYWLNFASSLDPNNGISVDAEWPEFSTATDSANIFVLDETISTASTDSDRVEVCAFFDSIGYIAPFSMPDVDATSTTEEATTTDDQDAAEEGDDEALTGGTVVVIIVGTVVAVVFIGLLVYMACQQKQSLAGNGSIGRKGSHMAVASNLSTDLDGGSTADKTL